MEARTVTPDTGRPYRPMMPSRSRSRSRPNARSGAAPTGHVARQITEVQPHAADFVTAPMRADRDGRTVRPWAASAGPGPRVSPGVGRGRGYGIARAGF